MINVLGHFHPAIVHLPIGFLLLAVLMQWVPGKKRAALLQPAISYSYLAGCIAAVLSCMSGWILASGGGYEESTLQYHRWMGIFVAIISIAGYYSSAKANGRFLKLISLVLLIGIMIAGHLGGTLTHGEGYLTKDEGSAGNDSAITRKTIANAQEAVVYGEIIKPVLQQKCYSCHSATKQKGGLRVDDEASLLKGGKDGIVITPGNPESSEMYKRVMLDPLEEKHMPPKGKLQLTENERLLLHWWIATGMDFTAKAKALDQPPAVKIALNLLEQKAVVTVPEVPSAAVDKAEDSTLTALRKWNVTILPVAVNSNYLTANLVNVKEMTLQVANALVSLKQQLIWLRMPGTKLSVDKWKQIGGLDNLIKLSVEHSNISDEDLAVFATAKKLQYLNLVDTKVTVKGLMKLQGLKQLSHIYLGQTGVSGKDLVAMRAAFPKAVIDSGGYRIVSLATDTELLRAPVGKR